MDIRAHTTSGERATSYAKFASFDGPLNLPHPRVGLVESCGKRGFSFRDFSLYAPNTQEEAFFGSFPSLPPLDP